MDQKKINYLIIVVVCVFLIILGVYYYKSRIDLSPLPSGEAGEEVESEIPTPSPSEGEVLTPSEGGGNSKPSAAENKAKFNLAMDNARAAILSKDYPQAINFYKEALVYDKTDTPYSGLFIVYGAQGEWAKALEALESAMKINPYFVDYWKSKIQVLAEQMSASYEDLKKVYDEGLTKVDPKYKINLVTFFAGMSEKVGKKAEAISLWEYAKQIYPENASIYQAEIDRLKTS